MVEIRLHVPVKCTLYKQAIWKIPFCYRSKSIPTPDQPFKCSNSVHSLGLIYEMWSLIGQTTM